MANTVKNICHDASTSFDIMATRPNWLDIGAVNPAPVVNLRFGWPAIRPWDGVFVSRDGKKWRRVHVVTRKDVRRRKMTYPPVMARFVQVRAYGR